MTATASERRPLPELRDLRGFVTVVDLEELANHMEAAGEYFRTFDAEDDATLLVHATTDDAGWAHWLVRKVIEHGGTTPEACADVELHFVNDTDVVKQRFARRSHAVVSSTGGDWLPIRRPVYGWDALPALRASAERMWGRHEPVAPYSYDEAIDYLVARGWCSEHHARMGSMPEGSLRVAAEALDVHLPPAGPRLLHVGNFVGVSLSYVLDWARDRDSVVVSVDPDIPHRGVEQPQRAVCDLLTHFGLTEGHLLLCGYSLNKTFSNDGVVFEGYDPALEWSREGAPENVLPSLVASGQRFDSAFIDGNHDPAYLRRELVELTQLIASGGVLVLDDVAQSWAAIRDLFEELGESDEWPYTPLAADGRIGVLLRS